MQEMRLRDYNLIVTKSRNVGSPKSLLAAFFMGSVKCKYSGLIQVFVATTKTLQAQLPLAARLTVRLSRSPAHLLNTDAKQRSNAAPSALLSVGPLFWRMG